MKKAECVYLVKWEVFGANIDSYRCRYFATAEDAEAQKKELISAAMELAAAFKLSPTIEKIPLIQGQSMRGE